MGKLIGLLGQAGELSLFERLADGWTEVEHSRVAGVRVRDIEVFAPAQDVAVVQAVLPTRSERDARRAAAYAVEDDLAQSPEDVHVALGRAVAGAMRPIAVVRTDIMDDWLATLKQAGLGDAALIAPQSLLPEGDVIVLGPQEVIGRIGGRSFAMDADTPDEVFDGLTQAAESLSRYEVNTNPADYAGQLAQWREEGRGVDLRQGAYQVRRPMDTGRLLRWRLAGGLAAVLGVAWVASELISLQGLKQRNEMLQGRLVEVVEAGWPELSGDVDRALADVRAQGGAGTTAFPSALTASAALYDALGRVEGSELRSLRYDRTRRQLIALVAYPDFGDGDVVSRALDETGIRTRIGDARQSGRQVIAEIVMEAGA